MQRLIDQVIDFILTPSCRSRGKGTEGRGRRRLGVGVGIREDEKAVGYGACNTAGTIMRGSRNKCVLFSREEDRT